MLKKNKAKQSGKLKYLINEKQNWNRYRHNWHNRSNEIKMVLTYTKDDKWQMVETDTEKKWNHVVDEAMNLRWTEFLRLGIYN